ncbi:cytochrome c [Paraflavisolibacter sp. H34]|uniref:c-type cytochrome n=1 Tax=Huijunlia imazamoxiresistens TaxID=3127457 RepID=UPI0030173876
MNKINIAAALLLAGTALLASCGSNNAQPAAGSEPAAEAPAATAPKLEAVTLSSPLNTAWVNAGKSIYDLKCQSCHKLTDEKLVGPGWKDVTKKRKPEWIMGMILDPEAMLNTDPDAQKLLEELLVRMPNQNLTKDEARQVLEFMRSNDGEK